MSTRKEMVPEMFIKHMEEIWPDFPITRQEYLHPTSDLVIRFLDKFLASINENVDELIRTKMSSVPHAEVSRELAYLITLYNRIRRFFRRADIPLLAQSFKLWFLFNPSVRLTHIIFRHLENFLLFNYNYQIRNCMVYEECKNNADALDYILQYQEKMRSMENTLATKHATDLIYITELKEKKIALQKTAQEDLLKKEEQERIIENLRVQLEAIEKKEVQVLKTKKYLENAKEEYDDYIRMKAESESLNAEVEEMIKIDNEKTQILRIKLAQEEAFKKNIEAVERLEEVNVVELHEANEQLEMELNNIRMQIAACNLSASSKAIQIKNEESEIKSIDEEYERLQLQWKKEECDLKAELQNVRRESEQLQLKKKRYENESSRLTREISEFEIKNQECREQEKIIQQHWLKNYSRILESNKTLMKEYVERSKKKSPIEQR